MQGGISSKRFSERSVGSVPSVCPTHTFKPTPVFSSDQFNQSVFVENFERVDQATSKEEIATKATAIIINGDLGSLTARICGVYRAAKGLCCAWISHDFLLSSNQSHFEIDRHNLFVKDGDIAICVIKTRQKRWELKTEDQLTTKSYVGYFDGLSDDFTGDNVQLLTGSIKWWCVESVNTHHYY